MKMQVYLPTSSLGAGLAPYDTGTSAAASRGTPQSRCIVCTPSTWTSAGDTGGDTSMHSLDSSTSTNSFLHWQYNFFTSSKPDCKLVWNIQLPTWTCYKTILFSLSHNLLSYRAQVSSKWNSQTILQSSVRCSMLHMEGPVLLHYKSAHTTGLLKASITQHI